MAVQGTRASPTPLCRLMGAAWIVAASTVRVQGLILFLRCPLPLCPCISQPSPVNVRYKLLLPPSPSTGGERGKNCVSEVLSPGIMPPRSTPGVVQCKHCPLLRILSKDTVYPFESKVFKGIDCVFRGLAAFVQDQSHEYVSLCNAFLHLFLILEDFS